MYIHIHVYVHVYVCIYYTYTIYKYICIYVYIMHIYIYMYIYWYLRHYQVIFATWLMDTITDLNSRTSMNEDLRFMIWQLVDLDMWVFRDVHDSCLDFQTIVWWSGRWQHYFSVLFFKDSNLRQLFGGGKSITIASFSMVRTKSHRALDPTPNQGKCNRT